MVVFLFLSIFVMPILAIIFCLSFGALPYRLHLTDINLILKRNPSSIVWY
ncbi:hypothetical protein LCM20_09420 [Halobacillus litoralis]|nr:hypothetical protein [Halobacillus litoralis]MCA0970808.1 hypothetical protein [Halobacillus litoralis]